MDYLKKDIRIMTIERNGTKRQFLNQELRVHGFHDITGIATITDGIDLLKKEHFDWLLLPLSTTDEPSGLAALEFLIKSRKHCHIEVSFLLQQSTDELREYLKKGFELGLFSYFEPYNSKTDIQGEFKKLFDIVNTYESYAPFVAAAYLRKLFMEERNYLDLLELEKSINKLTSRFPRSILHMAEAYCLCNEKPKAASLINQAATLDKSLIAAGNALRVTYKIDENAQAAAVNIIHLNKVVVIDPDEASCTNLKKYMAELGVGVTEVFLEAAKAIDYLKSNRDVGLVLFEWQQKDVAGPILLQKIRSLQINAPLIAINETISKDDLPILKEMGLTHFIKKPLAQKELIQEIFWIVNQNRDPSEPHTLLEGMRSAQKAKNLALVASLKKKYFSHPKVSEVDKIYANAEISYHAGFYHKAKMYALEALESGGDSLPILSLLGKSMMQLREFEAALRCLENAQVISPTNVERMCTIAESHLELENDAKFAESLAKAKKITEDNEHIHIIEAKAAIKHGEHQKASTLMQQLDSLRDIVIFTNNRAVALIKTDHYPEGLKLYDDAIRSIPEREAEILATLQYNVGLARARKNELPEALKALKKGESLRSEKLGPKINSLRKRVEAAIISGKPLTLLASQEVTLASESENSAKYMEELDNLMRLLELSPGSHCLNMIYVYPKSEEKKIQGLMKRKVS